MGQKGGLFREIDEGLELIKRNLALAKEKDDKKLIAFRKKQFDALKLVADYVFSYNWVKKEKVKLILEDMRLNNYDYSWVMRKYDLKPNDMKCFVYRNMDKIKSKVGEQTIDLILSNEDKVNLGLLSFRLASGQIKLEDMFNTNLLEIVPKAKEHYFSLSDCVNELKFLYTYSKFMMDFSFNQLDKDKLEFVLWLLSSPTDHYKVQQKDLIAAMLGKNLTMDEFIDSLQTDKQPFENDDELRDKYNNFAYSVEEKVVEEVQVIEQVDEVQEVENIQEVDDVEEVVEDFVEEVTEEVEEDFVEFEDIESVSNEDDFVDFEDVEVEEEKDYDFGEDSSDFVEEFDFEEEKFSNNEEEVLDFVEEKFSNNEEEVLDFVEESPKTINNEGIDLSIYSNLDLQDDFEEDLENKEENQSMSNEEVADEEEDIDLFRDSEDEEVVYKNDYDKEIKNDDSVIVIEEDEDDNIVIVEEEEYNENDEDYIEEKQKAEIERLEAEGYLMGMPDDMDSVEHTVVKESKPKFDMSGFSQSYGKPKQQFKPNIQNRNGNFGGNAQNNFNRKR